MAKKSNFAKYIKEKEINDKKQEIAKAKAQMKKEASALKAKALKEKEAEENRALEGGKSGSAGFLQDPAVAGSEIPSVIPAGNQGQTVPKDLGKSTGLVFFRQYNTYQALLEVRPKETISAAGVFAKTVLYIMRWFCKRLGDEAFAEYPEIAFLKDDYPLPENYAEFDLSRVKNINGLDFIDLETAYLPEKNAWLVCLTEPDNGHDRKNFQGRTFTTEIMVYGQEKTTVLGIRESCREPRANSVDSAVYRPGFVRDMFYDEDLMIGEYGLEPEYAFDVKPVFVNGKSADACNRLMEGLISSGYRQMPVLFVPESVYAANEEEVNHKTGSLLGFAHVVVWTNTCRKLFAQVMLNEEFAEVAEDGQIIFYRTNYLQEYPVEYFETDGEEIFEQIKIRAQREPLRKLCDYRDFAFKPSWWEVSKNGDSGAGLTGPDAAGPNAAGLNLKEAYENEIDRLNQKIRELERDNSKLQSEKGELEKDNKGLGKSLLDGVIDSSRKAKYIGELEREIEENETTIKELKQDNDELRASRDQLKNSEKERYTPLINLPSFGSDKAAEFIGWIRKYYPEELIVLPSAEKSLADDKRNVDYHRLCMMIHYLAGYTKNRNAGGLALDTMAARDYDPEEAAYKVTPVSSGAMGATEMHKSKYTVVYKGADGKKQEGLLDLHIKYGKGGDSNMIRIYFLYSPELGKSIIGYLPGHLPTSKDGH